MEDMLEREGKEEGEGGKWYKKGQNEECWRKNEKIKAKNERWNEDLQDGRRR